MLRLVGAGVYQYSQHVVWPFVPGIAECMSQ